ncbi:MAG: SDR family oxidoreductase [Acidobacteriota bacterium]
MSLTGGVDVCVANAGIWPPTRSSPPARDDPLRIQEVIQVNLLGAIYTARAFLRQVESTARRGSALVLVGSTAGRFGEAGHTEYAVSKGAGLRGPDALVYKNEVVAIDPGGRCNLVEPGWTIRR